MEVLGRWSDILTVVKSNSVPKVSHVVSTMYYMRRSKG